MKIRSLAEVAVVLFLAVPVFVLPPTSRAQVPAGPMPQVEAKGAAPAPVTPPVQPRTTILGAWKLNRDESDLSHNRKQSSGDSNGGRSGGRGMGGGGYGGYGGHGGYGRRGGESDEERQKMRELFTPPNTMTLSMTGAEVDLLDDRDRKRALMTDGRKLQKSKDDNYQEIAAKWDGNRLATEEKNPHGGKMSRTFELSSDGTQLFETMHMTSGRDNTPLVVRFVYDIPIPPRTAQ